MPAYNSDTIALGIIAEGRQERVGPDHLRHPVMPKKAIVIALATGLVESNLTMYANYSDPESLGYPHDAVGSDANSVGVFQQRAPWWGTVAERMDVALSSAMFYAKLARTDYASGTASPGSYAQQVQRSAYPDRYDQRMAEAETIYNRLQKKASPVQAAVAGPVAPALRPAFREVNMWSRGYSSRSRPPTNFFLHTQEGNGTAESLAKFCDGSNNVSYHYTVRDGVVANVVDTDYYSWSVLDANVFSINLCFAGSFAGWSREQWLKRERDIEIAAFLAVQDARKYGFSTQVIAPPYKKGSGISDHKYVTQCLKIGTHTDVGNSYPWDVFKKYVEKYSKEKTGPEPAVSVPATPTKQGDDVMASVPQEQWDRVYSELTRRLASRSPLRHLGEGEIDTLAGMALNTDGNLHVLLVKTLAELGDFGSLELLAEVAGADTGRFPDRAKDAVLARVILADIESTRPHIIKKYLDARRAAQS